MSRNIKLSDLLEILSESIDEKGIEGIASGITKKHPEKANMIIDDLKLNETFNGSSIEIITAKKLSITDKKKIESKLSANGTVDFIYEVEPKLLAGIVIRQGEDILDNSLRRIVNEIYNKISI